MDVHLAQRFKGGENIHGQEHGRRPEMFHSAEALSYTENIVSKFVSSDPVLFLFHKAFFS